MSTKGAAQPGADLTGKLARGFAIRDEFTLDEESLKKGLATWAYGLRRSPA
jgi:hypothetical protein